MYWTLVKIEEKLLIFVETHIKKSANWDAVKTCHHQRSTIFSSKCTTSRLVAGLIPDLLGELSALSRPLTILRGGEREGVGEG